VLEQLGEPFVTTRPGKSRGEEQPDEHIGMGLGFFIAKRQLSPFLIRESAKENRNAH
jgi:signal transduction histidine kinase